MPAENQAKRVILAVDDAPENLQVLKGNLSPEFIVKVAINGMLALKIAGKSPVDLILLDVQMPKMDGYEVCRRLKEDESTASIPVVFLTAELDDESRARGMEAGAVDYMTKPIETAALAAVINQHLNEGGRD
jgi:putative two-component system response regulator